jgi:hypothetical protein
VTNKNPFRKHPQFVIQYLNGLLNPYSWVVIADELLEASKVLEPQLRKYWSTSLVDTTERKQAEVEEPPHLPQPNLHGPYFILVSYALENLFKALIIGKRRDEISSQFLQEGRLPMLIKTHNLVKLSKAAEIKIDIGEEDILTRLSRQSEWKSRYPVPVELNKIQNIVEYSNGKPYFTDYYSPKDIDRLNAIVQKVRGDCNAYMNFPRASE